MTRNPNYDERPLKNIGPGTSTELVVIPPKPLPRGARRKCVDHRSAAPSRHQLVIIPVDESASMKRHRKCDAATNAVQETVYLLKMKSPIEAAFDVAIFGYGDIITAPDAHLLKPVTEIDEDDFHFDGSSGGTRIKGAMLFTEELIDQYERDYLSKNDDPERVPPPLIILLSDGYNGDGNPVPIATRLKSKRLSIGVPPIIVTVGIEYGGGEPHVELLTEMASKTDDGEPLYYDIKDANQLIELVATLGSSVATSPDDLYRKGGGGYLC